MLVDALAFLCVLPGLLIYRGAIAIAPGRRDAMFQMMSQALSLGPGLPGDILRRAFYRRTLRRCSRDCSIGFGTIFATPDIEIGARVYIGAFGNIAHSIIGANTLLGSNVTILAGTGQHNIDRLDVPVQFQGGSYTTVRIGEDVWIGNGAIVANDIGTQAVVGTGAVVVKPVRERAIVGGNPARVLGERGTARGSDPASAPRATPDDDVPPTSSREPARS